MIGRRNVATLSCAFALTAASGMACSGSTTPTPQPAPPKTLLDVPNEHPTASPGDIDDDDDQQTEDPNDAGVDAPALPPIFGKDRRLLCAVGEPIKSGDACSTAADCAPSSLCHAPSCVAAAKAPQAPPGGVACTMNLVCRTTDVGRCDCVDGVCALVAR